MGIVTIDTETRTRFIHVNGFVLLGLSVLLLGCNVKCIPLGIFSLITGGRFVLVAFPLIFGSRRISHTLLHIHLTLRGWWLLLRSLRRQRRLRC